MTGRNEWDSLLAATVLCALLAGCYGLIRVAVAIVNALL